DPVGTNVDFLLLPRLKEFQIEDELGQGGYGTVYQAFHVPTSTKCCIKILFQPNKAENFLNIIDKTIPAVVSSPFILRTFACYKGPSQDVTVTEYIDGFDAARIVSVVQRIHPEIMRVIL